jgi:hypothetical protein
MSNIGFGEFVVVVVLLAIASIQFMQGFKSGYERCMKDAVENKCAIIAIVDGKIKYEWIIPASATAELK